MPEGVLKPEVDYLGNPTGVMVCVSCWKWNCWHLKGERCDIRNCGCTLGATNSPSTQTLNE